MLNKLNVDRASKNIVQLFKHFFFFILTMQSPEQHITSITDCAEAEISDAGTFGAGGF